MDVLLYLAARPGQVISKPELMEQVWRTNVVDDAIHRAVSLLREALGDSARRPSIIETVPRRGYRLLVVPDQPAVRTSAGAAQSRLRVAESFLLCALIVTIAALALTTGKPSQPRSPATPAATSLQTAQQPALPAKSKAVPANPESARRPSIRHLAAQPVDAAIAPLATPAAKSANPESALLSRGIAPAAPAARRGTEIPESRQPLPESVAPVAR